MVENSGGLTGPNGLSIVGNQASSEFSDCQVAEIVIYARKLSDAERRVVESYLMQKYAL